jgi:hypothetical protein
MYKTTDTYYSFWMTVCCPGWIVSCVSRPIIRRYNRMYTAIGNHFSFKMNGILIQPAQPTVI